MTEAERREKANQIIEAFFKDLEKQTGITVVFLHIDLRIPGGQFIQVNFHEDEGRL